MTNRAKVLAACLFGAVAVGSAGAGSQHADFVLFGKDRKGSVSEDYKPEHRFVHPMTSPYFHEDSFVTSDLRGYFLYHDFPTGGLIDGGTAKVYALQVRLALTDQLQLVAYKDGYTDFDAGLLGDSGWNDVAAGLKWNFLSDWKRQLHAAVGVGYELAIGDPGVLQNNDEFRVWGSINKGFGPLHLGATANAMFATGEDSALGESDYLSYHLHADYYVCSWFSPVVEVNGYHTFNEGNVLAPFSGIDVTSLGGGDDVVTVGLGAEIRPHDDLAIRGAYEFPITDGTDLYGSRLTFSVIWSF